jgi:hypothetical protein
MRHKAKLPRDCPNPAFLLVLDRDDFGLNQFKIVTVIDRKRLERDCRAENRLHHVILGQVFSHPALEWRVA